MASICRLARTLRSCHLNSRRRPSHSPSLFSAVFNRSYKHQETYGSDGMTPEGVSQLSFHMVLAGFLGFGVLDVAFADGDEATTKFPPPPESTATSPSVKSPRASSHQVMEEIARKDKARLEELLKNKGNRFGSYPHFTVSVKGSKVGIDLYEHSFVCATSVWWEYQIMFDLFVAHHVRYHLDFKMSKGFVGLMGAYWQVTIKFLIPQSCEIPLLITNLVSRLGVKADDNGVGSDMTLRAWDSGVAWQLTLSRPKAPKGTVGDQYETNDENANDGLCILMFRPLISSDKAEIEFMKPGSFTLEELDALASILQAAGQTKDLKLKPRGDAANIPAKDKTIASLEGIGVKIYGLKQSDTEPKGDITWENIAGYDDQKREIEDTILFALKSPEVYDDIARGTRCKFETNRPRAVLFEGPPGTGKTSCARVIANQTGVPLLHVPLEVIMSKYYGESERLLGKVFSLANEMVDGSVVFLDEVDSIAIARDSEIHEATRRLLSVLLRQIDGFEQENKVVVIAATNRKQDLDPALLSRFDSMITFGLPDQQTREAIVAQYAKHLTKSEISELASVTEEMSGRDIKDVCQQAERHWASKIIRGQAQKSEEQNSLPPLREYTQSALKRRTSILSAANPKQNLNPLSGKPQFDFL